MPRMPWRPLAWIARASGAVAAEVGATSSGAEGGTRTRTARRPLAPQVCCSTPDESLLDFGVGAPTCSSAGQSGARQPR